jgi:hypothetical protein
MQQPVAITHVFVREATLFGTKQQRYAVFLQALVNQRCSFVQRAQRMPDLAVADSRGAHNQAAIRDRFLHARAYFGLAHYSRRTYGRTRLAKCFLIRIHHAKMHRAEVAHRSCHRTEVQRVACRDQNYAQVFHPVSILEQRQVFNGKRRLIRKV